MFGAGHIEDLSWKQLLDTLTCTECGRCQGACPAWNTGKPLSPEAPHHGAARQPLRVGSPPAWAPSRHRGRDSRRRRRGRRGRRADAPTLVPHTIEPDVLWSCLTCGACVEECPVDIEHVDTIVEMRRYEVLMESRFPTEAGLMLRNIENQGDPWGLGGAKRTEWTEALDFEVPVVTGRIPDDIEYLYWVGCAGALDERARKATQATARMLHRAGVRFAILGPRESCTGDPARRLGNEYLYQEMGKANIATLNEVGAKKVVASCPHCFNSLVAGVPRPRRELRGDPPLPAAQPPGRRRAAHAGVDGRQGHLPRPLLPGPPQPGLRRAAVRARRHRRGRSRSRCGGAGRRASAAAPAGPGCGWRRTSASGSTWSAPTRPSHRRRRRLDGLSLLPDHAGRRRAGPASAKTTCGCSTCPRSWRRRSGAVGGHCLERRPLRQPSRLSDGGRSGLVEGLGVRFAEALGHGHEQLVGEGRHGVEEAVEPRCSSTSRVISVSETTVAERGLRSRRESSPKYCPGPEGGDLAAVAPDRGGALDDEEELAADGALLARGPARRAP